LSRFAAANCGSDPPEFSGIFSVHSSEPTTLYLSSRSRRGILRLKHPANVQPSIISSLAVSRNSRVVFTPRGAASLDISLEIESAAVAADSRVAIAVAITQRPGIRCRNRAQKRKTGARMHRRGIYCGNLARALDLRFTLRFKQNSSVFRYRASPRSSLSAVPACAAYL